MVTNMTNNNKCREHIIINLPTIVTAETDQHNTGLAHLALRFELHLQRRRLHGVALDHGGVVAVVICRERMNSCFVSSIVWL